MLSSRRKAPLGHGELWGGTNQGALPSTWRFHVYKVLVQLVCMTQGHGQQGGEGLGRVQGGGVRSGGKGKTFNNKDLSKQTNNSASPLCWTLPGSIWKVPQMSLAWPPNHVRTVALCPSLREPFHVSHLTLIKKEVVSVPFPVWAAEAEGWTCSRNRSLML